MILGDSETVESKNGDVIGLAEASRLFSYALSCLHADLTSTFESEQLASRALRLYNPVGKQREAIGRLQMRAISSYTAWGSIPSGNVPGTSISRPLQKGAR